MGMSRDTFYRYQQAVEEGGVDALLNQNRRVPNIKNRVDEKVEKAVVQFALDKRVFAMFAPPLFACRDKVGFMLHTAFRANLFIFTSPA